MRQDGVVKMSVKIDLLLERASVGAVVSIHLGRDSMGIFRFLGLLSIR